MSFVAARLSIVAVLCLTLLAGPCNALEKIMVPNLELARGGNNFGDSEKLAEKEIRLPMVGERLRKLPNASRECELLEDSLSSKGGQMRCIFDLAEVAQMTLHMKWVQPML